MIREGPQFSNRCYAMNLYEKIPTDLKVIPKLIQAITEKIRQLPLDEEQIHDIKLSLQEALVNAIKHGNRLNPNLSVEVSLKSDDSSLIIIVTDQGKGFDFKNISDPTKPDNLQNLFGRGILLIKNHMDNLEFFYGGRSIKMIKFFKRGSKSENK